MTPDKPREQPEWPPPAKVYFRVKVHKGFFDGLEEVEAGEKGAVAYVPESLLRQARAEAFEEAADIVMRCWSEDDVVVADMLKREAAREGRSDGK
jgi:hypothetical protein